MYTRQVDSKVELRWKLIVIQNNSKITILQVHVMANMACTRKIMLPLLPNPRCISHAAKLFRINNCNSSNHSN